MSLFSSPNANLFYRSSFPKQWDLRIRYLGTAGFVFEKAGHTIVVDPFVTRPGLWTTATKRLIPDRSRIQSYIPKADHVLVGHAHHDHILDAPELCKLTGATLIGSRSSCNVARAAGVPEAQVLETRGHQPIPCGPHTITGLRPSMEKYSWVALFPGEIPKIPHWPMFTWQFRHGHVLNWHIQMGGSELCTLIPPKLFQGNLQTRAQTFFVYVYWAAISPQLCGGCH